MRDRGIKIGFAFLNDVATFSIPLNFNPFWDFVLGESIYWDVFIIGIQNTIIIALLGIPTATVLGVILGIALISPNWLLRMISSSLVETFRNTPLLLQLLFWALCDIPDHVQRPPRPCARASSLAGRFSTMAGIYLPAPEITGFAEFLFAVTIIIIVGAIWWMNRWGKRRQDITGKPFPIFSFSLAFSIAMLLLFVIVAGDGLTLSFPELKGLNYRGGLRPPKELLVLWFGLTIYTSTYIAENVRAGILSVSGGQSEAGMALGVNRVLRLRLVIMPQALRVIIPPTISQFLNLTKNSSLAVAVGYPDIVSIWVGIALNQTGQALIIIGMAVIVYECINGLTSLMIKPLQQIRADKGTMTGGKPSVLMANPGCKLDAPQPFFEHDQHPAHRDCGLSLVHRDSADSQVGLVRRNAKRQHRRRLQDGARRVAGRRPWSVAGHSSRFECRSFYSAFGTHRTLTRFGGLCWFLSWQWG